MSIFKNLLNAFVPVRERREAAGSFNVNGAEIVFLINGDAFVNWGFQSTAFIGTVEWAGSIDGVNFQPLPVWPHAVNGVGGTIPVAGQPLITQVLAAADTARTFTQPCGQFRAVRCRVIAYTSGTLAVVANSGVEPTAQLSIEARASTLLVTATGAAAAAVTATIPAVAGLRAIIDFIQVTRSATAVLVAAAAPVVVTTTGLPGTPALTFGSDVAGIGIDKDVKLDFGSTGLAATALNTAVTVVCPVYTGVIWRVNVAYRLGL
jgi:hypothetical protein